MIQKYYEKLMEKAEQLIKKECDTCIDYGPCWTAGSLQEKACNNWKPEYTLLEEKMILIQRKVAEEVKKRKQSIIDEQNQP